MKKTISYLTAVATALAMAACSDTDSPDNFQPQLTAVEASDITRTEATLNGTVTLQGETEMPSLWFAYGTGKTMETKTAQATITGHNASIRISDLKAGTGYFFKMEGYNGRVTMESNTMTFTTAPNNRPEVGAIEKLSEGPTSIIIAFDITSDGGEAVTETGCYITDIATNETKKITAQAEQWPIAGSIKMTLTGLKQNNTYSLCAYAVNRVGETKGEATAHTTGNAVVLLQAGDLEKLMDNELYSLDSLSIKGDMNGDDLRCLRLMMGRKPDGTATEGRLKYVNMADAHIVEGGGPYGSERFTVNNVVGYGLFADCNRLETVVFPTDAVTIEKDAMKNCTALKSITVAAAVSSITPSAGCTAIEEILVSEANTGYKSIDGVLLNAATTAILWFPMGKKGSYTLPPTITEIGDYAFQQCSITHFTLPETVKEIGKAAFFESAVEEVTLPDNLELIPTATFQNCKKLNIVRMGTATVLMGDYVFDGSLPAEIHIAAPYAPACESNTFANSAGNIFKSCTIYVPKGRKPAYRNHKHWGQFEKIAEETE